MKHKHKKAMALLLALSIALPLGATPVSSAKATEKKPASAKTSNKKTTETTYQDLNQQEIVKAMGAGWNLGNQMEASQAGTPVEDAWTQVKVTERLIRTVKREGFKTIRIPISYLSKIGPGPDYAIDSEWLDRVQEIVDWTLKYDLYAIINIHGDGYKTVEGGWLLPDAENQDTVKQKYAAVWKQIATRFKNYGHHLIYESMNEIGANIAEMAESDKKTAAITAAYQNINAYNQTFLDTIRQTGGNNDKRWVLIPGLNTNIDYTTGEYGFQIPEDTHLSTQVPEEQKRIMVSVHYYDPWPFCGDETYNVTQWGEEADPNKQASYGQEADMDKQFNKLKETFTSKGYPVIIGEYGAIDKSTKNDSGQKKDGEPDPQNNNFRATYAATLCRFASQKGIVPVYWDNGWNGDFGFGLINRSTYEITQPSIIKAIIDSIGSKQGNATGIALDKKTLEIDLAAGKQTLQATLTPQDAEDTIQWESSDTSIAEIDYKGNVTPKGTGSCLITATTTGGASAYSIIKINQPKGFKAGLYAQSAHDWSTMECADYLELTEDGGGSYTISLTGTKNQMSKLATLFIKDVTVQREVAETSILNSAQITIDSVKFNTHECTLSIKDYYYEEIFDTNENKNTVPDICLLNYWYEPANTIAELTKNPGSNNGCSFPEDWYEDGTNTIAMEVTVSNVSLKEIQSREETPAESISISKESLDLAPGSSQALTAALQPETATEKVLWHSDNQKIAKVAQDGTVTAGQEGEATVRALTYSGKEATCTVKVGSSASQEPGGDTTDEPSQEPSTEPSAEPSQKPTAKPSVQPSATPTKDPGADPGKKPDASQEPGNQTGSQGNTLAKGTTFTAGKLKYKVTGTAQGKTTVAVQAPKSKKTKSLTVPASVKKNGNTYTVTSLAASAFKNCKKLKKITIGKNVATIGKNAFSGCKALKKLTVKTTKLKTVGKNALKGIHKKAVIKVPKKKQKKYQKLWKKKGQRKTVKIK